MVPGDYNVQIQILEGKDLKPKSGLAVSLFGNNAGSADPMVEVSIKCVSSV
jgi:hypothetical protein